MLRVGDRVGMIAPAGASDDALHVQRARANLQSLAFDVLVGRKILSKHLGMGGTDEERASDFNEMVRLPEVKAIFCMSGGYGTTRMLDRIDYDAFRENPKVVIGFSDITGLTNALTAVSRVVTFHGPMPTSGWGPQDIAGLKASLMSSEPLGLLPGTSSRVDPERGTIVPGIAEGELLGGNLCLVSALAGTPQEPDFTGKIVFIEEIGEAPYRVDRMLTQLMNTRTFKKAAGIAFGSLKPRASDRVDPNESMIAVLRDRCEAIGIPAATGFPFGHIRDQVTLPLGARARLDATQQTLTVLQSGVVD